MSNDGGNTFKIHCVGYLDSTMITFPAPAAVGANRFSVAYSSRGAGGYPRTGLLFNFRNHGGVWLDSSIRVTGGTLGTLTICDNSSAIHIVGFGERTGDWDLSYWGIMNENTWTRRWLIDDSILGYYYDYDPHLIATLQANLYLVWARKPDSAGTWQICFMRSTDNGDNWSVMTQISSSPIGAWNPKITARRDSVFVFWEDHRQGAPKIYYRFTSDQGITWSTEEPIAGLVARNPAVAIDNNRIYLTWQDYRDGNWEVYFKYLPVSLPRHDVGQGQLITPQPRLLPFDSIIPQAMVRNYGDVFETFTTYLAISPSYFDSAIVTVAPEDSGVATFPTIWNVIFGSYPFKLWTTLANDNNQMNDTLIGTIQVVGDS